MIKRELYVVEEKKVTRQRRFCPRCGPGVFLGEHKDRYACGRCGYTEFKKDSKPKEPKTKESAPPKEEKPKEE